MNVLSRSLAVLGLLALVSCNHPKATDPIAHFPFDGNIKDTSGHHHDATAHGTIHYGEDRFGRFGHTLLLDGTAYLSVPDSADLNFSDTSSFTIYTWIKTKDMSNAGLVCKGAANNSLPGYCLDIKGGRPHVAFTATGGNIELTGPAPLADNLWHLVTVSVSPAAVDLYLDAHVVAQRLNPHLKPDSANKNPLLIGNSSDMHHLLNGSMDACILDRHAADSLEVSLMLRGTSVHTISDLPPGIPIDTASTDTTILGMCWIDRTATIGYCCGTHGVIEKTSDGGATWTVERGGSEILRRISFTDPENGIAVGDKGVLLCRTSAGWQSPQIPSRSTLATMLGVGTPDDIYFSDVKHTDNTHAVIVGSRNFVSGALGFVIILDPTTGTCFQPNNAPPMGVIKCIGVQKATPTTFWVMGESGLCLQCDCSTSYNTPVWQAQNFATNATVRACDFLDASTGVAGTDDGTIYTYNSGWGTGTPNPGQYVVGLRIANGLMWKGGISLNDFTGFTEKKNTVTGSVTTALQLDPLLFVTRGPGAGISMLKYLNTTPLVVSVQ